MSRHTPWGYSDSQEQIQPGIIFYSTPSHGGYHVSAALNRTMPDSLRLDGGWYEEDCDWARVVVAFPLHFPPETVEEAKATLRAWCPRAYERFYGVTLNPGESYMLDHHPDGFGRGLQ